MASHIRTITLIVGLYEQFSCAKMIDPDIFLISKDPSPGYVANVGNAFVGYDLGCPTTDESSSAGYFFVAGTYSGNGTVTPSRRALIPHQHSVYVSSAFSNGTLLVDESWVAELDIRHGIYRNTTVFSADNVSCEIELSWIAHRVHHNLSVLHISADTSSPSCSFHISSCNANSSNDVDLVSSITRNTSFSNAQDVKVLGQAYRTLIPESSDSGIMNLTVTSVLIPQVIPGGDSFTSYLEVCSSAWGGNCNALPEATEDFVQRWYAEEWSEVQLSHSKAWGHLWEAGIEVTGNDTIAAAINSSLYYILSSVAAESEWSVSPGGLVKNSYNGHVFWDCETWMLPALVPFFPDIAKAFLLYRTQRAQEAQRRASLRGYGGMMMPWESAFTGRDVTPEGNIEGDYEIHITADVPLAARLVYHWSGDLTWLTSNEMWEVIENCSLFLALRASCEAAMEEGQCQGEYTLRNVQPPDERAGIVNSSVYTNAAASALLQWVAFDMTGFVSSQELLQLFMEVGNKLSIPVSTDLFPPGEVHPEYEGYAGQPINQADAVLLQFPLLFPMDDTIAYNDLRYYENLTSVPGVTRGFYTGDSSYSIGYLRLLRSSFSPPDGLSLKDLADDQFAQAFPHIDMSGFFVWREKVDGGHVNFLTGAGGFLQNVLYGYGGLLASEEGLYVGQGVLPFTEVQALTFRGLRFRGQQVRVHFSEEEVQIDVIVGAVDVSHYDVAAGEYKYTATLTANSEQCSITLPQQRLLLTVAEADNGVGSGQGHDDTQWGDFTYDYLFICVGLGVTMVNAALVGSGLWAMRTGRSRDTELSWGAANASPMTPLLSTCMVLVASSPLLSMCTVVHVLLAAHLLQLASSEKFVVILCGATLLLLMVCEVVWTVLAVTAVLRAMSAPLSADQTGDKPPLLGLVANNQVRLNFVGSSGERPAWIFTCAALCLNHLLLLLLLDVHAAPAPHPKPCAPEDGLTGRRPPSLSYWWITGKCTLLLLQLLVVTLVMLMSALWTPLVFACIVTSTVSVVLIAPLACVSETPLSPANSGAK